MPDDGSSATGTSASRSSRVCLRGLRGICGASSRDSFRNCGARSCGGFAGVVGLPQGRLVLSGRRSRGGLSGRREVWRAWVSARCATPLRSQRGRVSFAQPITVELGGLPFPVPPPLTPGASFTSDGSSLSLDVPTVPTHALVASILCLNGAPISDKRLQIPEGTRPGAWRRCAR